ncbi:MAG TPA: coproporphyrinogen III oxidase, partial [Streptosporangiaceae bacterium]
HVGGTRWWNVKHPAAYGARITSGQSPAHAREILTKRQQRFERVLLLTRLAGGCPVSELEPAGRAAAQVAVSDGLASEEAFAAGRVVLTRQGRLLADSVVRALTG